MLFFQVSPYGTVQFALPDTKVERVFVENDEVDIILELDELVLLELEDFVLLEDELLDFVEVLLNVAWPIPPIRSFWFKNAHKFLL